MLGKNSLISREDSSGGRQRHWQWLVSALLLGPIAIAAAASKLGLAGISSPISLYLDQPRVHYLGFLVLAAVVVFWRRWWRIGLAVGLFAAVNLHLLSPVVAAQWSQPPARTVAFSIVHANLGAPKEVEPALVEFVREWQPDFLSFQEVRPEFAAALPEALPQYAPIAAEPRPDKRGVALLAKREVLDEIQVRSTAVIWNDAAGDRPFIEAEFSRGAARLRLLGFHSIRPDHGNQAAEYEALAAWFQRASAAQSLAIGDFNATPWSQMVRHLLTRGNLPDLQTGFSFAPTWPAGPIGRFGVPIDFAVHSAGLHVETHVGPHINSDHYPIYSRVAVEVSDDT